MKSFLHSRAPGCSVGVAIPMHEQHHWLLSLWMSLSFLLVSFFFSLSPDWIFLSVFLPYCSQKAKKKKKKLKKISLVPRRPSLWSFNIQYYQYMVPPNAAFYDVLLNMPRSSMNSAVALSRSVRVSVWATWINCVVLFQLHVLFMQTNKNSPQIKSQTTVTTVLNMNCSYKIRVDIMLAGVSYFCCT